MQAFVHGIILAFGLILPLGVQNLFVFQQGVGQPVFLRIVPVIVMAALCDTLLIVAAVQGVSIIIGQISWLKGGLLAAGTVFLLYMGWLSWKNPAQDSQKQGTNGLTIQQQLVFTVSVSLLNPHAVLDTIGVIGTSAIGYEGQAKLTFTLACILVSWLWFFCLAVLGRAVGTRREFGGMLQYLNKVSAVFMWGSALYLTYSYF